MSTITDDLKKHLSENEHIKEVYFDAAGNHFFNSYDLAGKKYSRIISDLHGSLTDEQASEPYLITETLSREEVLKLAEAAPSAEIVTEIATETAPAETKEDKFPEDSDSPHQ